MKIPEVRTQWCAAVVAASVFAGTAVAYAAGSGSVWLDAPADQWRMPPGQVTLVAHASGRRVPTSLALWVDEQQVGNSQPTSGSNGLVVANLTWAATEGQHRLVIRDEFGNTSLPVVVVVGWRPEMGISLLPTANPSPSATPTPTPTSSAASTPVRTPSASRTMPTQTPPEILRQMWRNNPATHPSGTCTRSAAPQLVVTANNATRIEVQLVDGATGASWTFPLTASGNTWAVDIPVTRLLPNNPARPRTFAATLTASNGATISQTLDDLVVNPC